MTKKFSFFIPKKMYKDAEMAVADGTYASIDALMKEALRKTLYPEITENGFTVEFEEEVLRIEKENNIVGTWETEEDIHKYFKKLKQRVKKRKNDKNQLLRTV